jgi:hypothetical protein
MVHISLLLHIIVYCCLFGATALSRAGPPYSRGVWITQRRITACRTSLDEWSALRRDNTLHSQQTNIHGPGGIRTHNLSRRAATDLRLRPRAHWDRHIVLYYTVKIKNDLQNNGRIHTPALYNVLARLLWPWVTYAPRPTAGSLCCLYNVWLDVHRSNDWQYRNCWS